MSRLIVRAATAAELVRCHDELAAFERGFVYPLGADSFHIDHGADYLAFFRALGEPSPYVAEADGHLAGVLIVVRRRFGNVAAWYVCDLKVAAGVSGAGTGRRLLRAFAADHLRDGAAPAFAVSMNAADGSNRLAALARRCAEVGTLHTTQIVFFTLGFDEWSAVAPEVERALGPVTWFDPRGTKDIVLASTGAPMPLLHAQYGPHARGACGPARAGSTHMLCLPAGDPLATLLAERRVVPAATATALHRTPFDWRLLLTSDI